MKHYLLTAFALLCAVQSFAQSVDVDKKTGLVTLDDKEAFYLAPKSVGMMDYDYSLQNLEHKELAYLKHTTGTRYHNNGSSSSTDDYLMVFTKTGNQCTLTGFGLITGTIKPMAKMIAAANLVQNGAVSEEEERKFIIIHNGSFVRTAAPVQNEKVIVVNNDNARRNIPPADISLKESSIYNNSEMVGVFKRTEEAGITTISVYNNTDALVCKATHPTDNPNADWTIVSDGRTATILYNSAAPLEKLFKYLVEKGIL
jgi:hypothetical protein